MSVCVFMYVCATKKSLIEKVFENTTVEPVYNQKIHQGDFSFYFNFVSIVCFCLILVSKCI